MRLTSVLLGGPLVATVLIALIQGTRHLTADWPVHAHHHLTAHISGAVGLSIVSLVIVAGPLQRREPWTLWAMLVAGVAIFGGYWLGNIAVGLGEPGTAPNASQALLSIIYLSGLVLGWRQFGVVGSPKVEASPE